MDESPFLKLKRWQWWLLVAINIFFLIAGQAAAVLLGRFYYDKGGNSKWMATLVQTAGFPVLCIPWFLLHPSRQASTSSTSPSIKTLALLYFVLGVLVAGDNMLYSVGLLYLSASTYSLICATQLAFNAVFSYFLNSQKFTALILNSVVILSLSAALIAVNDDSDGPSGVPKGKFLIGFLCTLGASALYSLLLSFMQLSFQKVLKKETFSVVLEMQICTSVVASGLQGEYDGSGDYSAAVDPFEVYNAFFGGSDGFFSGMGEPGGFNFNLRNNGSNDLDIWYELHLNFEESIFGGEREIMVSYLETCNDCGGTGAKTSSCVKSCTDCGGKGGSTKSKRTPFGVAIEVSTCSSCGGKGKIITDKCRRCSGCCKVKVKRSMRIIIPPGVADGFTKRIRGEGNVDKKRGFAGDLFVVLRIGVKQGIWRDGLNLYSKINVDYTEAILGTVVKVETVEGIKDLRIPCGIQPGDAVKLSRLGVPDVNKPSVRGDHHFIVNVLIPKDISNKERKLIEEVASLKVSKRSCPSDGMHEAGESKERASIKRTSRVASLWNSVKTFLGRRESREGFASITADASSALLLRSHCKSDSSLLTVSYFSVFVFTLIWTLMRRNKNCCIGLNQRKHTS